MVTRKEPRIHWGMLAEGGLTNASMKLLLPPEKVVSVVESWKGGKGVGAISRYCRRYHVAGRGFHGLTAKAGQPRRKEMG